MAYQHIYAPGPRSNRFPFAGLGACCRACERGLPCGSPLAGGGAAAPKGAPAPNAVGADPSLGVLADDVKALALQAQQAWGDVALNTTIYERLKRQATQPASSGFRLTPEEAKQFVTGTVVDATAAYVKGMQLASLAATNPTRRDQLLATQRQLAQKASELLNQAQMALASSQGQQRPVGGLGDIVCAGLCLAAIVAVAAGVVLLLAGAAVYSWAQRANELQSAMVMADRICRETPGGCSAAERAALVNQLRMPDPITTGVNNVTQGIGQGLRTVTIALGIGGALSLAAYAWLRLTPSGRRAYARLTGRAA